MQNERLEVPDDGPSLPITLRAEPGWRTLVLSLGVVEIKEIVGWRIFPTTIASGVMGLETTSILACAPMVETSDENIRFLGIMFDPKTSDETAIRKRELYAKIYERDGGL